MQIEEGAILTQSLANPPVRTAAKLYLGGVLALLLLSVVAAFGVAPHSSTELISPQQVVRDIELPLQIATVTTAAPQYWRSERVQQGDTVTNLIARLGVDDKAAVSYLLHARTTRSLYQLLPGKTMRAVVGEDGKLYRLSYVNRDGTQFNIERMPNGFVAGEEIPEPELRMMYASGQIERSLFAATDAAGVPETVALQMADVFSSDVDFYRDLRKGDRFTLVYESKFSDGDPIDGAQIVAAEFINQGQIHRAFRYRDVSGHVGYYSDDGRNVRKTFLRSPLEFSRMTSGFTRSRVHPVLGTARAHKGIDYGAPVGTKVRATAIGQVAFVGQQAGYGNVIIVRHANGYSTVYGHLSAFAKRLHAGSRVEQGELIGFVGKTGLATGPHLHYEFRLNDAQQNPLKLALPSGPAIPPQSRAQFTFVTAPLVARLDALRGGGLAQLD